MIRNILLSAFLLALAVTVSAAPAHAQATRTWISGVGDDANPCSRTAPCKTWAGAISKTAAGGEIDVLDPGGFGGLTITKAITLDGGGGQVASTLVQATNGITVSAGTSDVVIIRNVRFNGLLQTPGTPGTNGIQLSQAGALIIENCDIFGFGQSGIALTPSNNARVSISNTHIQNSNSTNLGSGTGNADILLAPNSSANLSVTIDRTYMEGGWTGVFVNGNASGSGVIHANVTNSVITNHTNSGVAVASSGPAVTAYVVNSVISYSNNTGAAVAGGSATLTLGADTITNNVTGVASVGGTLLSFKNNMIAGNGTDGTPITAVSGYSGGGQ